MTDDRLINDSELDAILGAANAKLEHSLARTVAMDDGLEEIWSQFNDTVLASTRFAVPVPRGPQALPSMLSLHAQLNRLNFELDLLRGGAATSEVLSSRLPLAIEDLTLLGVSLHNQTFTLKEALDLIGNVKSKIAYCIAVYPIGPPGSVRRTLEAVRARLDHVENAVVHLFDEAGDRSSNPSECW
jgi:hypothetical protein